MCQAGVCTPGCLIGGSFVAPRTFAPDAGEAGDAGSLPLCCAPSVSTSAWSPQWGSAGFGVGAGIAGVTAIDLGLVYGPSVATGNSLTGSVTVINPLGNGVFGAPTTYSAGESAALVGAADVTGDGIPDLFLGTASHGTVFLMPGLAGGALGPAVPIPAVNGTTMLGTARHCFSSGTEGAVLDEVWNAGNPSGPLETVGEMADGGVGVLATLPTTVFWPDNGAGTEALVADLNGDGLDDVAVTADSASWSQAQFMAVFLNDGSGRLGGEADFLVGHAPEALVGTPVYGRHFPSGAPMLDLVTFDLLARRASWS